jgi:hypothetical protein
LRALEALIAGNTVAGTATLIGVTVATVHRWLQRDVFTTAYAEARARCAEEARQELKVASLSAARTLVRELQSPSPTTRLRAAKLILEFNLRGEAIAEIERRLGALEGTGG